jgi:CBS-domain-containing membrane protein
MSTPPQDHRLAELELSDEDILDAMQRLPGYLDITTEDFRAIYHVAHAHALARMFGDLRAAGLMHTGLQPLHAEMSLEAAARAMLSQGTKALPVVDGENRVVGILTETDLLRCRGVHSALALWLATAVAGSSPDPHPLAAKVGTAMTIPAIAVDQNADFHAIAAAFHRHPGHTMPVVDAESRLCGLLSRKQFIAAYPLAELS